MVLRHRIMTVCVASGLGLTALLSTAALAKEGPGGVAPEDGQTRPQPVPALPSAPISLDEYNSSENLVFTIFGEKARKIYSYYASTKAFDFNRPGAPDHKIEVIRYEGQLKCVRRQAARDKDKFRCNFLFHPAAGNSLTVGAYTYTLDPVFNADSLEKFVFRLQKDTDSAPRVLIDESCPRYLNPMISQGHLSCAYFHEQSDIDAFFFPEDLNPQGVAVGWGVVQPGRKL